MNLFVRNISFKATEEGLKRLFEEFGNVTSCKIIKDRVSNRSKGYGFIEMADEDAKDAIASLEGFDFEGRKLSVSKARPKEER